MYAGIIHIFNIFGKLLAKDTYCSYAKTHIYHRRHVICLRNFHLVVGGQSWERGIRIVLKYPITKCIVLGKIHL